MGGVLALALAGLVGFLAGAYLASTGERAVGITLMGGGLLFQLFSLRKLRSLRNGGGA